MSLLKINDVRTQKTLQEEENEQNIAIGIDLGTSNSVVAYIDENGNNKLIEIDGATTVPSAVLYLDDGTVLVGKKAHQNTTTQNTTTQNTTTQNTTTVAFKSMKRFMGKAGSDIQESNINFNINKEASQNTLSIRLSNNKSVSVEEIIAEILKYLKVNAEKSIGKPVTKAVITVPAYFDESARQATKNAATLAGLEVLRLINEPTAAAFAYGLDENLEGKYIIYDLGGGTFDVSILQLQKGIFKVLATSGDTSLGGDDIDKEIATYILSQTTKLDFQNLSFTEKDTLLTLAKQVKEGLSQNEEVQVKSSQKNKNFTFKIHKETFNKLISKIVEKTINICKLALSDAQVTLKDIKGVILVGGSTAVPYVQEKVEEFFAQKPFSSINPDEVVALGASYQAGNLTGRTKSSLLLDVLPLSLGLETAGGVVEKIIHRNTLLPIKKAQEFTTSKDGQTSMLIHVLQGERELVVDQRSLGKFTLKGIPPLTAGTARILVTFIVDADGLLTVEAEEKTTKIKQQIEIKPSWGLSFAEMRKMIETSMENAQSDIQRRLLKDAITEAENLIYMVQKALNEDTQLLNTQEIARIKQEIDNLSKTTLGSDRDSIEEATKSLDTATNFFAEKRMSIKIKKALKGKNIEEIDKLL